MSPPGPFAPAPPVNVAPGWSAPGAAPKRDANRPLVVASWVVAVCTAGYMLPWAIAQSRSRSNCRAVALVNLLAEWTVIGWVVALIMACGSDPIANAAWAQQPTPQGAPRPGFYPSPSGSGGRAYWNGHAWTAPFT